MTRPCPTTSAAGVYAKRPDRKLSLHTPRAHGGKLATAVALYACIDIGSNTTRLLVAEPGDEALREVMAQKAFTRLGKGLRKDGRIAPDKVEEVAEVVATQVRLAEELEVERLRAVATAAIRGAANGADLVEAVRERAGVEVEVLDGDEEARLAFVGATRTLNHA